MFFYLNTVSLHPVEQRVNACIRDSVQDMFWQALVFLFFLLEDFYVLVKHLVEQPHKNEVFDEHD